MVRGLTEALSIYVVDDDDAVRDSLAVLLEPEGFTVRQFSSVDSFLEVLEEDLSQFLMRASKKTLGDDKKLEDDLRRVARHTAGAEIGKKPEVTVVISRLS